jgi:hypothetical protein
MSRQDACFPLLPRPLVLPPITARAVSSFGASRPLPSVRTKVRLLNRLPTLDLGGGSYSSCPTAVILPTLAAIPSSRCKAAVTFLPIVARGLKLTDLCPDPGATPFFGDYNRHPVGLAPHGLGCMGSIVPPQESLVVGRVW